MFQKGFFLRFGKLSSFLALDVLLSLSANLSFFSLYLNEKIRPTLFLFYLSSVWALYLADHLWDAKREKEPLSERGAFYLRFRFAIVSSLILSSFVSLFIGISFEFSFLWNHLPYLLSFVLFFVLIVTKLSPIPKEILVSGFYTLGVLLPFSLFGGSDPIVWIFFLHVFANVLLTYNTDREFDEQQRTFTLIQYGKPKTIKTFVHWLLGIGTSFLLWAWIFQNHSGGFLIGMGISYFWLGVCSLQKEKGIGFKSLCELSYLPMFLPQIIFFFSLLP
ncbi:putative membrane protein [Leptospira wolbachii serovar Codice str. CDC]|uniref:Membrane protein n=2 Tax=Leptospira TaxID=171 RepID=R9A210_9LEPT|nr:putative membrane protein [Leptospira wolbachii serovar Codice str. CDC]